ncbi:c-type cytochrome biogenesis protein CcmI, partial [bacterium]|nr:c-type cytochrome biogenesis protein CcmI [bacterium]
MTATFLILAALLIVASLALLLPPLLRRGNAATRHTDSNAELSLQVLRDQLTDLEKEKNAGLLDAALYDQEKAELERRALEDGSASTTEVTLPARRSGLAALVAVAVPALAIGLYALLGNPAAMNAPTAATGGHSITPDQIRDMVVKLEQKLKDSPQDGEGWIMLGRAKTIMGRYDEAAAAFAKAVPLLPPDASLLADYADALATSRGRKLAGEPEQLVAQALKLDPKHLKGLALSGSAAFERGDFKRAASEWRKILEQLPPDAEVADEIRGSIAEAEAKAGIKAPAAQKQNPMAAAASASVAGTVSIDPALKGKVASGDTIFIFARAENGPRMPLA